MQITEIKTKVRTSIDEAYDSKQYPTSKKDLEAEPLVKTGEIVKKGIQTGMTWLGMDDFIDVDIKNPKALEDRFKANGRFLFLKWVDHDDQILRQIGVLNYDGHDPVGVKKLLDSVVRVTTFSRGDLKTVLLNYYNPESESEHDESVTVYTNPSKNTTTSKNVYLTSIKTIELLKGSATVVKIDNPYYDEARVRGVTSDEKAIKKYNFLKIVDTKNILLSALKLGAFDKNNKQHIEILVKANIKVNFYSTTKKQDFIGFNPEADDIHATSVEVYSKFRGQATQPILIANIHFISLIGPTEDSDVIREIANPLYTGPKNVK